jgi:hypothetical protein
LDRNDIENSIRYKDHDESSLLNQAFPNRMLDPAECDIDDSSSMRVLPEFINMIHGSFMNGRATKVYTAIVHNCESIKQNIVGVWVAVFVNDNNEVLNKSTLPAPAIRAVTIDTESGDDYIIATSMNCMSGTCSADAWLLRLEYNELTIRLFKPHVYSSDCGKTNGKIVWTSIHYKIQNQELNIEEKINSGSCKH